MFRYFKYLSRKLRVIPKGLYNYKVRAECDTYQSPLYVGGYSSVTSKTKLGKNVSFNGLQVRGVGYVTIGDNFHSGQGCLLITSNHNYDNGSAIPYDNTHIEKTIVIDNNVWLGDRVIVLGGVIIGEGAIIQAGSVVVSDIPSYSIAGGHPARVFSSRNVAHYDLLKKENKFH